MPSSATCKLPCVSRTSPCSCSWRCTEFTGRTSSSRASATRRSSARCARRAAPRARSRSRDAAARHDPAAALQRGDRRRAPPRADGEDGVSAREARDPGARRLDRREPPDGAREGHGAPRRAAAPSPRARAPTGTASSTWSTSIASTARATRPARSTRACKVAKGELVAIFDADFVPRRDVPPRSRPALHRRREREGRHGAGPLGSHEPRRVVAHARAGAHARRSPPRREPRALRRRLALQLLRHRRHVAQGRHRHERRLAARHAHRGSRSLATARRWRAGASSTARTSSRPPSSPRT